MSTDDNTRSTGQANQTPTWSAPGSFPAQQPADAAQHTNPAQQPANAAQHTNPYGTPHSYGAHAQPGQSAPAQSGHSGYGQPTGYTSFGSAGGPPPNHPAPPTSGGSGKKPRASKQWLMVGAAAVLAAVLASGGTALVMNPDQPNNASALVQVPATSTTVASNSDGTPNWEAVANAVRPSVVAIDVSTQRGQAAGSGVILDADNAYILTNNHVVDGAQQIAVALADGRMFQAKVVGTDSATDLAVLQLTDPPSDLTAATLGTSADLKVGESVMAVGNPLGLSSTVTTGIVSALDRPVSTTDQFTREQVVTNAIQIDAAINPGNSGGPLFDGSGHVIGITSSIATAGQNSGSIGLGFAIPVDLVSTIADQLIASGTAEHAFLGVTLTDGTAQIDGATRVGAQVHEVVADTPAASAGLKAGDVIIKIGDHTVNGAESLTGYVRTYSSGDQVKLTVVRNGAEQEITATLATREDVSS